MKALDVNFAPPPPPPRVLMGLAGVLAFAALVVAGLGWRDKLKVADLRAEHTAKVAQAAAAERQAARDQSNKAGPPPPHYADGLTLLRQQQFPLNAVLAALETVAVIGVRITSVDIVTGEATVRVQVEFSDYEALMRYLEQLNAGEPVERWMLANAQNNAGAVSARPTATLTSRWSPENSSSR